METMETITRDDQVAPPYKPIRKPVPVLFNGSPVAREIMNCIMRYGQNYTNHPGWKKEVSDLAGSGAEAEGAKATDDEIDYSSSFSRVQVHAEGEVEEPTDDEIDYSSSFSRLEEAKDEKNPGVGTRITRRRRLRRKKVPTSQTTVFKQRLKRFSAKRQLRRLDGRLKGRTGQRRRGTAKRPLILD